MERIVLSNQGRETAGNDALAVLSQRKRAIIAVTTIGAVISAIVFLLLPSLGIQAITRLVVTRTLNAHVSFAPVPPHLQLYVPQDPAEALRATLASRGIVRTDWNESSRMARFTMSEGSPDQMMATVSSVMENTANEFRGYLDGSIESLAIAAEDLLPEARGHISLRLTELRLLRARDDFPWSYDIEVSVESADRRGIVFLVSTAFIFLGAVLIAFLIEYITDYRLRSLRGDESDGESS